MVTTEYHYVIGTINHMIVQTLPALCKISLAIMFKHRRSSAKQSEMDESSGNLLLRLSDRQRQCLDLVAEGWKSKEIARQLGLSPSTVDNHINTALERLHVGNRLAAVKLIRAQTTPSSVAPVEPAPSLQSVPPNTPPTDEGGPFALPRLGGFINQRSPRRRIWHIVQIALFGSLGMSAVVMTIAGLIQLFSVR